MGKPCSPKGVQLIEPGQRLELLYCLVAGGFGDKGQRSAALREQDKLAGIISD